MNNDPREQTVLVHYEDQHGHAQHLLWYTDDVALFELRLACGLGPGLSAAFSDRGIDFEIVRQWNGGAAARRELRRAHNNRRLCHRCCYGRAHQLRLFRRRDIAHER